MGMSYSHTGNRAFPRWEYLDYRIISQQYAQRYFFFSDFCSFVASSFTSVASYLIFLKPSMMF